MALTDIEIKSAKGRDNEDLVLRRRRGAHADDQAGSRYQSIIGAEHRGSKPTYPFDQMTFFVTCAHKRCPSGKKLRDEFFAFVAKSGEPHQQIFGALSPAAGFRERPSSSSHLPPKFNWVAIADGQVFADGGVKMLDIIRNTSTPALSRVRQIFVAMRRIC